MHGRADSIADPVQILLDRLPGSRKTANGWQVKCPAHDDRVASLCIKTGNNGGAVIKCQAGCSTEEVLASIGLQMRDLFPTNGHGQNGNGAHRGKIEAVYDYKDDSGQLLFQSLRYHPKSFNQRRRDHNGKWVYSLQGVRLVPYKLPELLIAAEDRPEDWRIIVEGEKDADRLWTSGLIATTNPMGAGKWRDEYSEYLINHRIAILPDNDPPGLDHARKVAASLIKKGCKIVRIIQLPGLPPKGDVSDFLDASGTPQALLKLIEAAADWHGEADDEPIRAVTRNAADIEPSEIQWLWPSRIPIGRLTLLVGVPGIGKSYLTTDIAARITTGTPWPDGSECEQGTVIFISAEDDPADTTVPRLIAHHANTRNITFLDCIEYKSEDGKRRQRVFTLADLLPLEDLIKRTPGLRLIIVDPIGSYLGGKIDSYRDTEVRSVLAPLADLAAKYKTAVVVVAHRPKGHRASADESVMGSRGFTGIARAVWHLCREKENRNRRLLLPGKQNLSREALGLAFSLIGEPIASVSWEHDPVQLSADEGISAEQDNEGPGRPADERRDAETWLREELADMKEHPIEELRSAARKMDFSWTTVKRAKAAIKVISHRSSFGGGGVWRLPRPGGQSDHPDHNSGPDGPDQ